MRVPKLIVPVAFILAFLAPRGFCGDRPSDLEARVSAILDRFPAPDAGARDGLSAEILGLGPEAVAVICGRLLPPGEGDGSPAEFALNGLAVYVTRPGAEKERLGFVKALLAALEKASGDEAKTFLISQVALAGRNEAAKPLAKHLGSRSLAGPAARALQAIGGPAAEKALLKALKAASPESKLAVIQALGEMRSRRAVRRIVPFAEGPDESLRRAALHALANIGDPRASDILSRTRLAASAFDRARAPSLYLLYAERLIASGHANLGLGICRELMKSYTAPGESHIASKALSVMGSVLGGGVLPDLVAAMDSPDPQYRGTALALAGAIPGAEATASFVGRLHSVPRDVQAEIVAMLGDRGDPAALPAVRVALAGPDKRLRVAAIRAAAELGGDGVLADLLPFVEAGESSEELEAAKLALLGLPGSLVVPEAVRLLGSAPPSGKAALLEILGEKGARDHIGLVFGETAGEDPAVRTAAIQALAALAGENDLPRLFGLLFEAEKAADVVGLQSAVVEAALRIPDQDRRSGVLLGFLERAAVKDKPAVLRILPRIGGERVLRAVAAETGSEDAQVRGVAVYALSQWPDFGAADELLRIASSTGDRRNLLLAFDGYVRLVGRSGLSRERKIELLRTALSLAVDDADKKALLRGLVPLRGPDVFRLLSGYLDKPALETEAIEALLEIASVQSEEERWLSGHEAISILRTIEDAAAGGDEKERARKTADDRLRQGGFMPLFDGLSLRGWKGLVADPPKRALMTAGELAKAQSKADERMMSHWKAAGGTLVFDGKGESLCTEKDYGDFELLVDWKIEPGGDSGIYLRGSPQVQIWDAEANPAGSGGLYNNQVHPSRPLVVADRPAGEWNTFRILMIGPRVTVYLNNRTVVDNAVLENYWERDKPIAATGQIELQAHGSPLSFRNIYIREIPRSPVAAPRLSAREQSEGFALLFNGADLAGWTGDTEGYRVEGGMIVTDPERGSGNLHTEEEFGDFVLRFEFMLTPGANNGLGIRTPPEGDAAYAGMEIQILEDGAPAYWNLRQYQYHGSVYGVVPARRGVLKPSGEWNSQEVVADGRRIKVVVNGTTVVDADLDAAASGGTMDNRDHPGLKRKTGRIGFLGHGSIVSFRNIRIRELDAEEARRHLFSP